MSIISTLKKISCFIPSIIAINCSSENVISSDNEIKITNISLQNNSDIMHGRTSFVYQFVKVQRTDLT